MRTLLVYPPFCPPTVPPHSITYLASYLRANSVQDVECLDLNAKFHRARFPALYRRLDKARGSKNAYSEMLEKYASSARKVHRGNNVRMAMGGEPELFGEMLRLIADEKPDIVGFSFVYNSQVFYGLKLIRALKMEGIGCVAGGPAAGKLVAENATVLKDETELLMHLAANRAAKEPYAPDFGCFPAEDYLSKEMVYPLRSSFGCSYGACAFCTHHNNVMYREIPLEEIAETIRRNRMRNLFFIDDNIPAERLLALAETLEPLRVRWWCQTRPTGDLLGHFPRLRKAGLASITFGVESGSQRILDSMGKGIRVEAAARVLEESHRAGVRNMAFVMFGFPGETEDTFNHTMEFLRRQRKNIDIVSASVFGLQKGSRVHSFPESFGVYDIRVHDTPLGESIGYKVRRGIGVSQAKILKEKSGKELASMNRMPKICALLKEQSLFF